MNHERHEKDERSRPSSSALSSSFVAFVYFVVELLAVPSSQLNHGSDGSIQTIDARFSTIRVILVIRGSNSSQHDGWKPDARFAKMAA
jgi:hypothetical protein